MDNDKYELIRARAYEIWEREGRPAGREHEHWQQAELELQEATGDGAGPHSETTIGGDTSAGDEKAAPAEPLKQRRRKNNAASVS